MPRRVVNPQAVAHLLRALNTGAELDQAQVRIGVLHLLHALAEKAPGRSIEVRIPPYGAVQCGEEMGPAHRRGIPPNVVETDPLTWVQLATGGLSWNEAVARGSITASGARADLRPWLPVELYQESSSEPK